MSADLSWSSVHRKLESSRPGFLSDQDPTQTRDMFYHTDRSSSFLFSIHGF